MSFFSACTLENLSAPRDEQCVTREEGRRLAMISGYEETYLKQSILYNAVMTFHICSRWWTYPTNNFL